VFNPQEIEAFAAGKSTRAYDVLGAHPRPEGTHFSLWAPNADAVCVVGDFNAWNIGQHPLSPATAGVWTGFARGAKPGQLYKFAIRPRGKMEFMLKADPFGTRQELPPETASCIHLSHFKWSDGEWLASREVRQGRDRPISIYEVHLGSWRRTDGRMPRYSEIAEALSQHVLRCGFTHVEFLPLSHHPYYGSWGYQCLGYFAPAAIHGEPDELRQLIDHLHRKGIGVILDWVPAHFPTDAHGLSRFDGTHLFEHEDPRKGFHPDWDTAIFNYGRKEVRSFLLSSARYWIEEYHIDGIRVDAVASMLYLDYSRKEGEWIPNEHGGNENLEAVSFLKELNESLFGLCPGILTIAEESTAWPGVSRPLYDGGLGFGYKWDMGWMHDVLQYLGRDPVHRKHHHNELTFRGVYAFAENYVLALSHDEVVHGKGSLLSKMSGDEWQQRATLRCLFALQIAQPGKKMLFMGMEFGQRREWNHEGELDWWLLDNPSHRGLMDCLQELNRLYRELDALHSLDLEPGGVSWSGMDDSENSVICFIRKGRTGQQLVAVCNLTPEPKYSYRVGVPEPGTWVEQFNSDHESFGGSGVVALEPAFSSEVEMHGLSQSIEIGLPPLGVGFWLRKEE
jgi:1,4-alpha-glucan branching enzyme